MPLRGLGYFAELYKMHLGGEDASVSRMYDRKLLKIPAPKYYVFYNGSVEMAELEELRLSSAYDGEGDVEVVAHMINVNKGFNEDLMRHCKPMSDYSEFVFRVRECLKKGYAREEAIREAIDGSIRDGILSELLRRERDRVENILIRGITEEEREELHEMQLKREREEGRTEANYEAVDRMTDSGICDAAKACEILGVDINVYNKYLEEKER